MTRVIISGGGTGGHIFPAIAIADAIRAREADAEILFIGAEGRMEMERVPAAGYRIEGLKISGIQRKLTAKNLLVPYRIVSAMLKARSILDGFKPDVVIGVGGYASGPTLRMASMKDIPTLIQEQNSYPGITNKILAKKASTICVAYEGMEKFFPKEKIVMTGNPVRKNIQSDPSRYPEALQYFNLKDDRKIILVTGGSLGAGTLNNSIRKFINCSEKQDFQVIWQTGRYYYDSISRNEVLQNLDNVRIFPFIDRMDLAYTLADVVISRAGAIAISELCIVGKPVILIPSPNVTEDHQTKNAMALVRKNAAVLLRDEEAVGQLSPVLTELLENEEKRVELSRNISALGIPDASGRIAEEALRLAKQR
ncbi:MAG: undecaprenyldiphospho-muramoylpentapeptide beta-N-acetylglucosaminyltransferase [Syntrophothermus sp.]